MLEETKKVNITDLPQSATYEELNALEILCNGDIKIWPEEVKALLDLDIVKEAYVKYTTLTLFIKDWILSSHPWVELSFWDEYPKTDRTEIMEIDGGYYFPKDFLAYSYNEKVKEFQKITKKWHYSINTLSKKDVKKLIKRLDELWVEKLDECYSDQWDELLEREWIKKVLKKDWVIIEDLVGEICSDVQEEVANLISEEEK